MDGSEGLCDLERRKSSRSFYFVTIFYDRSGLHFSPVHFIESPGNRYSASKGLMPISVSVKRLKKILRAMFCHAQCV